MKTKNMNRSFLAALFWMSFAAVAPAAEKDDASVQNLRHLGRQMHHGPEEAEKAAQEMLPLAAQAGPVLQDLMYALSYDEERVAVVVSSVIAGVGAPAVAPLRLSLQDGNFFIRRRAADILGQIGPAAASAVPQLIDNLSDTQYEVHMAAENALRKIGAPALSGLTRALTLKDEGLRRRVVDIMGSMGPAAAPALMNTARRDESSFVRLSAIENLPALQPLPPTVIPALINSLRDLEEGVRGAAADALGSLGAAAQPAVKELTRLSTDDPDSLVRKKAQDALGAIVPPKS